MSEKLPKKLPITYVASVSPLEVSGKRYADVYVIDPTINRTGWSMTTEAIERAKQTALTAPLIYTPEPGEKGDFITPEDPFWGGTHKGDWKTIGAPVEVDVAEDGSMRVRYEVDSERAWKDMLEKKAHMVSPALRFFEGIVKAPRMGGDPSFEVRDADFSHVLLIPEGMEGAYPKAGVENLWENGQSFSGFSSAIHAAYSSHLESDKDASLRIGTQGPSDQTKAAEQVIADPALTARGLATSKEAIKMSQISTDPVVSDKAKEEFDKQLKALQVEMETLKTAKTTLEVQIKEKDEKLADAGKIIRSYDEGKGVSDLRAKIEDQIATGQRITDELEATRARLATTNDDLVTHMAEDLAQFRVEARLLNHKDVLAFIKKAKELSVQALKERIEDAKLYAAKLPKLGLRPESFGAGATMPAPEERKDLGYTIGNLYKTGEEK